jgi:predicted nicotinamide N-methyase
VPLRVIQGQRSSHSITKLDYPTVVESLRFGRVNLEVQHLLDVEAAIDLVFNWLSDCNHPAEEIEHLAPYFGSVWPSALALAEWVAREGEQLKLQSKRVLELGCGLAVPGLVAAKYGGHVTLSDGHPDVPRFLDTNIGHNGDPHMDYIVADWDGLAEKSTQPFDYVIASDVLYESQHADLFSKVIDSYCDDKTKVVISDPGRAYIQSFVKKMNDLRWRENLAPWTVRHRGRDQDIFLLTFERV